MQARWVMKCECGCGQTIYSGSQFATSRGKTYKPGHVPRDRTQKRF